MRRALRLLPVATLLSGCSFSGQGSNGNPDASAGDAAIDASVAVDAAIDAAGPITVSFQNNASYSDTHDTYVDSQNPDTAFGDSLDVIWEFDAVDDARLGLLRFGFVVGVSPDKVPLGAEVLSATLSGNMFNGTPDPANVRRILVPWDETTTFSIFSGDGTIDNTEFDDSEFVVGPGEIELFSLDVTTVVQGWVNDPSTNHGWMFFPQSANLSEISSSEVADETLRPKLEITYMLP